MARGTRPEADPLARAVSVSLVLSAVGIVSGLASLLLRRRPNLPTLTRRYVDRDGNVYEWFR